MRVDPEDFQRRYAELSDEALHSITRDQLVDVARQYYDEELARRGLPRDADEMETEAVNESPDLHEETPDIEDFRPAATFLFPDEAKVARALVYSAGILCYLENEHTLSAVWAWTYVLGGLRLMVPASLVKETQEVLRPTRSEEEITAEFAEESRDWVLDARTSFPNGVRLGWRTGAILAIVLLFFSPTYVDHLLLFEVGIK